MGLRQQAHADVRRILNDDVTGAGWPITVTAPDGTEAALTGWSNDIGELIDPDTGQAVSGRLATVALHLADLAQHNLTIPENVSELDRMPWMMQFGDVLGNNYMFKVIESAPDRSLGYVNCTLEILENAP